MTRARARSSRLELLLEHVIATGKLPAPAAGARRFQRM
jgi:hypothetical protein